jgi:cell division protein FtsI (penicillin-binding protein 3)
MAAKTNIKKEMMVRIYIGFLFICLLGCGIIGQTVYIQNVKGNYYRKLSDTLTIFPMTIRADRGNIYAKDGSLLATSLPIFDLYIDFAADGLKKETLRKNIDSVALLMENMFHDKSAAQYKNEFQYNREKRNRYYSLHKSVTFDQMSEIRKWPLFRLGRNKSGLIEETKEMRDHPFGLLALRTLGVDENLDGVYSSGIELKYNEQLQGVCGKKLVQKLGAGVVRPLDSKDEIAPQPGRDIFTTIDVSIQDVAQDALRRALVKHQADHGCVIVMETKTGKIRAVANLGRKDSSTYFEFLNYAVREATEPGSTFKLATIAALMEDGLVNMNTTVNCGNGVASFFNTTIKDHEAPETPLLTVKRAIEVSSNVAVAKLAFNNYGHAAKKFYNHLNDFGFTKKIEVEIAGAGSPVIAKPELWSGVSSAFIAHGYELQITPLHTLQFYNAIANNGVLVKPTFIEKVTHYSKTVDSTITVSSKILSERTVSELRNILEGVVENGTAMNLKTDYLQIAGKTGTAKIAQGKGGYSKAVYQASFCGYFPAKNPEYSMIVIINSPSVGGYYGNVVAGSIFREVADKIYASDLNMNKTELDKSKRFSPIVRKSTKDDLEKIYQSLGVPVSLGDAQWCAFSNGNFTGVDVQPSVMPDLTGMALRDAIYMMEQMGVKVQFTGKGFVSSQSVQPGEAVKDGQIIKLELGA